MMKRTVLLVSLVFSCLTLSAQVRKEMDVVIYEDANFHSAFPSVVKTDDGELLVAFRRAPDRRVFGEPGNTHIDPNSYFVGVRSKDGQNWSAPEVLFAHPFGGIQDPCMLKLSDGSILCEGYLWTHVRPAGLEKIEKPYVMVTGAVFGGGFFISSKDGGRTWEGPSKPDSVPSEINYSPLGGKIPAYNRGALCEGRNGDIYWAVASSSAKDLGLTDVHLMVSHDKGRNWEYRSVIASDSKVSFNETSLYETPNGDIVAFLRTAGMDDQACIARSSDGGATFSWQSMGFQGHPCHALKLADGRVLLTYGYRHTPFGVRCRILNEECTDFADSQEYVLRDDANDGDVGYTWSVQLDASRVLVVYYINSGDGWVRHIEGSIINVNPDVDYKDASLPVDVRVEALLSQMTVREKIAQLSHLHGHQLYSGQKVDMAKLRANAGDLGWGCVEGFNITGENVTEAFNTIQKYMVEETRLGIPTFTVTESLHGSVHDGSTIFPQSVAVGSTFDLELAYDMTRAISEELVSQGVNQVLAPALDVVRDLRWGRVEESFGEDPYLVGMMGIAETRGYLDGGVNPMLKPLGPGGAPLGGLNLGSVDSGERDVRMVHVKPFEMVVRNTDVSAVMSSYDSWNGISNSSSHFLLTDLLRNEWGFDGYVYSDWAAVSMLTDFQRTAPTYADAAVQAISAGLDVEASSGCYWELEKLIEEGVFDVAILDEAVRRVLRTKFRMGLFENPYRGVSAVMQTPEHLALSRRIADESIVLLKNEDGLLPLDAASLKSIAVIGPNADQVQFGDYTWSRSNKDGITPLQGLSELLGDRVKINYARGCDRTTSDRSGFTEAIEAASSSDVAILFLGSASASLARDYSDATCGEGFDLSSLELTGVQQELLEAVSGTGKPVVLVLVTGKPFTISWAKEHVPAIAVQWYGGQFEGAAIADMLFGKTVPCAKLPFSFPQSTGHLPCYYNHLPSDKGYYHRPGSREVPGRDYVFSSPDPLWEFGYGLSYTEFTYGPMTLSSTTLGPSDTLFVRTTVRNEGKRDAKEVVQLYFRDLFSSVATPVRQLKAFTKVFVPAGETREVVMMLPVSEMALYDRDMNLVVEPGEFEIMIGASSLDIRQRAIVNVTTTPTRNDSMEEHELVVRKGKKVILNGTVRDVQATPVNAVSITSKSTGTTIQTSKDGTFKIRTHIGDVLVVSADGIITDEIQVVSSDPLDVVVRYGVR